MRHVAAGNRGHEFGGQAGDAHDYGAAAGRRREVIRSLEFIGDADSLLNGRSSKVLGHGDHMAERAVLARDHRDRRR